MRRAMILCGLLAGAGLAAFLARVPRHRLDPAIHADAIAVFTGPEDARMRQGLETLAAGAAPRLLISGLSPDMTLDKVTRWLRIAPPPDLVARVDLGLRARDTVGNAGETAAWLEGLHARSVRLVTADYHMPRARFLLHRAMPGVTILEDPVTMPYGHRQAWLYDAWGVMRCGQEAVKLGLQWIRFAL